MTEEMFKKKCKELDIVGTSMEKFNPALADDIIRVAIETEQYIEDSLTDTEKK